MRTRLVVLTLMAWAAGAVVHAQGRGSAPWSTVSEDAQRTAWVRSDPKITKESVQNGGFQLLWKSTLDNQPKQLESLTQPLLLPNIISYKGFKALAFIGGSSDNVYAIDYDLNRPFWKRHLETASVSQGTAACPGALTAMTRLTPLAPPNPNAGRGSFLGAGGGANAPGARGRGVARGAEPPAPGQAGARGRGAGEGGNQNRNPTNNVYAISSSGMLHALNPQTGEDVAPPARFIGAGANLAGAILIEDTLYAAATGACGTTANGVYAIDLSENANTISSWDAQGASIAGTASPALSPSGTVYVATGAGQSPAAVSRQVSPRESAPSVAANSIVALDPRTLAQKDVFTAPTPFTSSPVVFTFKDKELVAAANQDGRLYLLGAASLGGADRKTPLAVSARYTTSTGFTPDALASWEEADGTRWILVPVAGPVARDAAFPATNGSAASGSIVAFKVVDQNGTPSLQPAWVSRDLTSPLPPAVVNGIVFAVAGGESRTGTGTQRARSSKPAVLYALDATTGKELWNSGTTIASFAHRVGPSAGDSQVYVVTYDGTVYAFGIPLEH